ncbi:MAG TPA: RecX family transcriptional regulator [Novosphingobium sp.]|nr:RecX family transcriptional regulator [Novosphingobium sp.]
MATPESPQSRRRTVRPLDPARLEELALAYVARFSVPAGKFRAYLNRKLRERGWAGEGAPPVDALVDRFVAAGYIDDAAWAATKSESLLRRGYGQRRVAQALGAAGIDEALRMDLRAGEAEARAAALRLAQRRGFGPFGKALPDREQRERQLAAMLRAGHRLDTARDVVDAATIEAVEEWAMTAGIGE